MKQPKLDPEARAFYKKYQPICQDNGSLTETTEASFTILCRIWSLIEHTNPLEDSKVAMRFSALMKHFEILAKSFGILNTKPPVKPKQSIGDILKNALQSEASEDR